MANLSTQINSGVQEITSAVKLARPIHWVKNLSIFAALIFTENLFVKPLFIQVFWAFIAFNFVASAAYILNDILDIKNDRLHPIKRFRPLAAGKVSLPLAISEALTLVFVGLFLAASLNSLFFYLVLAYVLLQISYSFFLKNIPIVDILIIASGFIIRIYSGAFVIDAHLSVWFLLCVISVALFLASGKRRAELGSVGKASMTRKSLALYPRGLLNSYVTMFGSASWMSWALFTFFESPRANLPVWLFLAEISRTTTINKLLMATIPVVIFGIMRYQSLIFEDRAEAPEKLFLTDKALIVSIVLWVGLVVWILYGGISL